MLVNQKIKQLEKEINGLKYLTLLYPNLKIDNTWDETYYYTKEVNSDVDSIDLIDQDTYALYLLKDKQKIYAEPYCFATCTDEGYEVDWLKDIDSAGFNRDILIKLMYKIHSHYLDNDYYHGKYPWIKPLLIP